MKKLLFIVLLLSSVQLFSQSLNDYQYVIVPTKFIDFDVENQYRLNTITKFNLEKMGFIAFYENSEIPKEIMNNRCDILSAEVIKDNNLLWTRLYVVFKDCYGKVVHQSETGKTKVKEFITAYPIALDEAFQSLFKLNYKYNGKKVTTTESVVQVTLPKENVVEKKPNVSLPTTVSETTDYSKLLFAQPTANGYQLVDSTPKVVYKLFKTDSPSLFLAQKGNQNGVVTLKDGSWFFEYQENEKVVSEKLEIKF
ncbi:hypothetical protein M0M57_09835 [Flavobacterium azooxidireducens]|uniref:Uncharacterized protein n=1 Tax=Flavobacterium azooxidireducens TaxID=1871076 RepID=A0ABY4KAW2_9FLAO|nr:hypothetical protein [Flavobacterium azooxidireducens]UPQ77931.1 hypothetical protein M0M57_09835 [Flavobacterium azooxidireducens]